MIMPFKSLLLGLAHVALLSSIGGKMLYDRSTMPHAWIKTMPIDPTMPIRGRYLRLTLAVDDPFHLTGTNINLHVEGDHVTMSQGDHYDGNYVARVVDDYGLLLPPVAFFISDKASDPSRHLLAGQELWVEASIPAHSPPRPIRLGIKHNGVLTPID